MAARKSTRADAGLREAIGALPGFLHPAAEVLSHIAPALADMGQEERNELPQFRPGGGRLAPVHRLKLG
jgi:hypothetical protein